MLAGQRHDPASRGFSFGVHRALDKAGAVLGPLAAWALLVRMGESPETFRFLFWVAPCRPAASIPLLITLRDRVAAGCARESRCQNWHLRAPDFKRFLLPSGVFALAYYSLGFILLRSAHDAASASRAWCCCTRFQRRTRAGLRLAGILGDRIRTSLRGHGRLLACMPL